jgi:UDP-N-acetylmuramate dehydrogenase
MAESRFTFNNSEIQLPLCRGQVVYNFDLRRLSWLKVGGPAQVFFQPEDEEDLALFLKRIPPEVPIFAIGLCSNLIIRDGGIPGIVIKLGKNFTRIKFFEKYISVGAGCIDSRVAKISAKKGIDLSFLRTIPGNIGGAVTMNAGCYGSYVSDYFLSMRAVFRNGTIRTLYSKDVSFHYRGSLIQDNPIITEVNFRCVKGEPNEIEKKMNKALEYRAVHQPVKELSCGSTFRNPSGHSSYMDTNDTDHSLKAWKLIDEAGLRGMSLGGAQISTKHPNFMINTGTATGQHLEDLGNLVIKKVKEKTGIELVWEIKRVGFTA